jgi:hypothetical protein
MASKRIGDVRRVLGGPRLPGIRLVFLLVWVLSSAAVSEVQTDQDEDDADDRTYKLHSPRPWICEASGQHQGYQRQDRERREMPPAWPDRSKKPVADH